MMDTGNRDNQRRHIPGETATPIKQLEFILANLQYLRRVDRGGKKEAAVHGMKETLDATGTLTPKQASYLDGIYESTMKGAGLPSVDMHIDKKKRDLQYPG